jgi:MocE subfamily Rieske [2Fe-2S] domain protein
MISNRRIVWFEVERLAMKREKTQWRDYSLVGKDAALAVERGLANAPWYTPPVPKEKMRELLERRDGPAIRDTILWFSLLFIFGLAGYLAWGSYWAILPFLVYGVLYASVSDSRWHETSHGTAFKTDWMNNVLYEIASFMVLRESVPWRWSHTRHHSDTIIVGRDPEIAVPRPANLWSIFLRFFNGVTLLKYIQTVFLHCIGRMTAEEKTYIPETEYDKVFVRARIYALIYIGVIALAAYTGSILPLMYIGLPNLYGAWLMVIYGLTQHAGLAEDVLDHRLNTRTFYMNRVHRYLYWNMGYHIEHHMFPLVPYHALDKLHEVVKPYMPRPYRGVIEVYRELIPALWRQSKDPNYYVRREIPTPVETAETVTPVPAVVASEPEMTVDGWLKVCPSHQLQKEDVLRFDHHNKIYAIYRSAEGQVYATEGVCTHGNALLTDGLLKGHLIECPKHNGRFDIRDGSPQRPPVSIPLKTYEVRESDGYILLNVTVAHGLGLTDVAPTYTFRVISNENVTPLIKELVLEPDTSSPVLMYQPGDYMQFEIPVYEERTLHDVDVKAPYAEVWHALRLYDLKAANPITCYRSYSFASNPATDGYLRFNIRLATPPPGQDVYAGVGSAYLFSLKPGDKVTAIGPFGSFHIKPTEREMIYLGGGSGMAPLRSHISYLFETKQTTRLVSYWFGARTRRDIFYQDYFEQLAKRHSNFRFHIALSEPLPEDGWTGYTGFIHEVLRREYLSSHPDPASVEYYLCGPLPMIRAAIAMLTELGVKRDQIISDEF